MKKLQASYNDDANKIVEQYTKEKGAIENLSFVVDLAMVSSNIKATLDEPQMFNKAWNHPNKQPQKMVRIHLQRVYRHEQTVSIVKNAQLQVH